jgi:xanthine dehydrogenase/oxidase
MDIGNSLNPTIDIGQVEGAFVQGTGWCTIEEIVMLDNGVTFTRGPSTYKIPSFNDIPIDFRVSLLKDAPNSKAIHSSKGIGEPPLFLAACVFWAIKEAVYAARKETLGNVDHFQFNSPATCERIRLSCTDSFTQQFGPK